MLRKQVSGKQVSMAGELGMALRQAIEEARAEELRFASALPESERTRRGSHDRWSAKDLLAHVAAAKARLAAALAEACDGREPSLAHSEAEVHAGHADDSWCDVRSFGDEAVVALLRRLGELCDARLTDPSLFAWLEGRAAGAVAIGYAVAHPLNHLREFRAEHEGATAAAKAAERLVAILESIPAELHDAGTREHLAAAASALSG